MSWATDMLDRHVASITDADEEDMDNNLVEGLASPHGVDWADFARRTCMCGQRLVDVYDYHDHLKAKLEKGP